MLLPTLAKAKKKANRLKCANQLGQISKPSPPLVAAQRHPLDITAEDGNAHYRVYNDEQAAAGVATGPGLWILTTGTGSRNYLRAWRKAFHSPSDPKTSVKTTKRLLRQAGAGAILPGIFQTTATSTAHWIKVKATPFASVPMPQGDSLLGFTRIGGDDSSRTSVGYNFTYGGANRRDGFRRHWEMTTIRINLHNEAGDPLDGNGVYNVGTKGGVVGWNGADATGSLKYYALSGLTLRKATVTTDGATQQTDDAGLAAAAQNGRHWPHQRQQLQHRMRK